ncbi:MAG: class I SAM-dependent methyltransferase [Chloroflexota bacterium]
MSEELVGLTDHAVVNRDDWNAASDAYQQAHRDALSGPNAEAWGVWRVPESELHVLGDVRDKDVLELGCGAAQWSIALARRGARVVGLDISSRQLEHARRAMLAEGVEFPLLLGSAEGIPLPDDSFDIVFCDHGAMSFADPNLTVPEVARLLRPGGILAFAASSPLLLLCMNDETDRVEERLVRSYFDLGKIDNDGSVEFQLPYGAWIRLFRTHSFVIERLIELRPTPEATTTYDYVPKEWASRWPAENLWVVRLT